MAEKQVRIDLVAEDHASPDIDKVADAAEDLEALKPEVAVTADTDTAVADLGKVTTEAKTVEALSPRVDVTADVDQAVGDLDRLRTGADDAGEGVKTLHGEADQSRSVLANMVGNSAQDLGALGGVAGTAGMAFGQLAEYASEGSINLAGLAAMAGPMAGVLIAGQALQAVVKIFSDRAQQAEADTKAWTTAMQKGGNAADNMAAQLAEAGEVMADTSDHQVTLAKVTHETSDALFSLGTPIEGIKTLFGGAKSPVKDLTELLADAGITVDQWTASVAGGQGAAATFAAALAATNLSSGQQDELLNGLTNSQKDYESAAANAAAASKVFGDRAAVQAENTKAAEQATRDFAKTQGDLQSDIDAANDEIDRQVKALDDQMSAAEDAADSGVDLQKAYEALTEATADTIKVNKDHTATSEDKAKALEAEKDQLRETAKKEQEYREEVDASHGVLTTATQHVDGLTHSLEDQAKNATPAARAAAYDYIIQLNQIPAEKATDIRAAVAAGDLATANKLIEDAAKDRDSTIHVDANTSAAMKKLQALQAFMVANRISEVGGVDVSAKAVGAAPGGATTVVNINMPAGARGVDVVRQVAGQTRRNGRRYGTTPVVNFARR